MSSIDYLGHIISAGGMAANPSKLQAMTDWPLPKDTNSVGLPPKATAAFESLKQTMLHLSILSLPNFDEPFDVTTDDSQVAVGVFLSKNQRPIAFSSKKGGSWLQTISAYDREMYAILEAVRKWRQYLLGRKFQIHTDQQSLWGLISQTVQTSAKQKWLSKLLGFDFDIHYTPGRENSITYALSRHPVRQFPFSWLSLAPL
ncbi:Retrovirus-related Pol polyprotein from transposon opus [Sesamum alatum]|uniref:Retrovirus-related Pol polyprotein from transposon opus n=1 Tax=Sesamum alatum TaxID=300844 RepID=A0AAE1Y299_9LAMI|nr:Retrovirus-related Pol polyprotein from transposon opus [Sesamum alatum]